MKEMMETSPKRAARHLKSCRSAKEKGKKATGCSRTGRWGDQSSQLPFYFVSGVCLTRSFSLAFWSSVTG